MFLIDAPDVGAPAHVQVRHAQTRPPQPQLLPGAGRPRQAAHLHEDQRAADHRAGLAGPPGRVVLLLGMQPGPCPHPHGAVLRILRAQFRGRHWPHGRAGTVKLVPMLQRPSRPRHRRGIRVGIEAAILAQAHQRGGSDAVQIKGELYGVVAGIEDTERHGTAGGHAREQGFDLGRRRGVDVRGAGDALHVHRRSPAVAPEAELADPLIGPPRHHWTPPLWREE